MTFFNRPGIAKVSFSRHHLPNYLNCVIYCVSGVGQEVAMDTLLSTKLNLGKLDDAISEGIEATNNRLIGSPSTSSNRLHQGRSSLT